MPKSVLKRQCEYLPVYNLEFPSNCNEFSIHGYVFKRASNYPDVVEKLARKTNFHHEFSLQATTGQNIPTATLKRPNKEKRAVLPWTSKNVKAEADLALLLSIMTGRDVTIVPDELVGKPYTVYSDPREFLYGYGIKASIPYQASDSDPGKAYNAGFINGLNSVYITVRSRPWQKKYLNGYFLFLAKEAFMHQPIQKAFMSSAILWEHLYKAINPKNRTEEQLEMVKIKDAVYYLLVNYFEISQSQVTPEKIQKYFAKPRNAVAHFGKLPSKLSRRDAQLFIELTEQLVAKILGLKPKNTMNTNEKLRNLFRREL